MASHLQDTPPTLESLAQVYGVSKERVRQLESRATTAITNYIRRHVTPTPPEIIAIPAAAQNPPFSTRAPADLVSA